MREQSGERITYLDLLRVISIFCMMMLHISASQFDTTDVTSVSWQVFNVYDSMVRFCVPEFVMISGVFFLNPKRDYTLKKLWKNNILRIVTAYFFWAFCYAVGYTFVMNRTTDIAAFAGNVIKETFLGYYHLWFLNMIVGIYLVVPFLRKIAEDKKMTEYFILLSFVTCYLGNLLRLVPVAGEVLDTVLSKSSLLLVAGYTGYFMAGYYFYTYDISKKFRHAVYALGALSLLATIAGTSAWSLAAGEARQALYDYLLPTTCFVAWAIFLFFKSRVSGVNFSERGSRQIAKLASLSFGMYLVHEFFNIILKMLNITTLSFPAVISVPVLACVVFALSFVTAWVMSKIPFARKYLM
ncbi:MAG: acyltransferase family protein [Roseburia sp.]|nr:acyltransferase family protein [Roseburia sp.]